MRKHTRLRTDVPPNDGLTRTENTARVVAQMGSYIAQSCLEPRARSNSVSLSNLERFRTSQTAPFPVDGEPRSLWAAAPPGLLQPDGKTQHNIY
jgi:hypothetical protein